MVKYPFQVHMAASGLYPNVGAGHIFKNWRDIDGVRYTYSIEFDLTIIKELFPECENEEQQRLLVNNVVNAIYQMRVGRTEIK